MKTKIITTKRFEKQLNRVPDYIQKNVMFWIFSLETIGLEETRKKKSYNDEALKGKRLGQRSIRLNKAYRLVYREYEERIIIELLEVHKHDY